MPTIPLFYNPVLLHESKYKPSPQKEIVKLTAENTQEGRREWLLNTFAKADKLKSNETNNQFWQQHNIPIELCTNLGGVSMNL